MKHTVEVEFDAFGWEALHNVAERQGVSVEELVAHAAMYYLADEDSGRTSHNVPGSAGRTER
jgi:predicted DNA-binding ribbon-helix-helix protein